jgi:predicted AAA+ superfamily ATPase
MNVKDINARLAVGARGIERLLPHVEDLKSVQYRFEFDFGLKTLPSSPGVITIRGARQYGKSTWLEQQLLRTVDEYGPGTAFYLNGDFLAGADALEHAIRDLGPLYRKDAPVCRLFIDEITAVKDWQKALKRLADGGDLRGILVVTTGSKASDLRHGVERLPGRKGALDRTNYLFTPVSFREFQRVCGDVLGTDTLDAYLMTGGSPIACAHIAQGRLPEYAIELVKDWVYGACAVAGRLRGALLSVMECLLRFGGTPVGQAKLAREAGLANNTVAAGYVELLADLLCVTSSFAWDSGRAIKLRRKPCKYHFSNTLAALVWHPAMLRTVEDFRALPPGMRAAWQEWAVAQELWRRAAIRGDELPEEQLHWRSAEHEIDFVLAPDTFLEVKLGPTNPMEFAWFAGVFPGRRLTVVSQSVYETRTVCGVRLSDFLLGKDL